MTGCVEITGLICLMLREKALGISSNHRSRVVSISDLLTFPAARTAVISSVSPYFTQSKKPGNDRRSHAHQFKERFWYFSRVTGSLSAELINFFGLEIFGPKGFPGNVVAHFFLALIVFLTWLLCSSRSVPCLHASALVQNKLSYPTLMVSIFIFSNNFLLVFGLNGRYLWMMIICCCTRVFLSCVLSISSSFVLSLSLSWMITELEDNDDVIGACSCFTNLTWPREYRITDILWKWDQPVKFKKFELISFHSGVNAQVKVACSLPLSIYFAGAFLYPTPLSPWNPHALWI